MKQEHIKQGYQWVEAIPAAACMLLMFQAYLIAPLSPSLSVDLSSSLINLAVPAFAIPFAISASAMIFIKPAINPRDYFVFSLIALCAGTYLLSIVTSATGFLTIRALTGLATGAMLPSAILLSLRPHQHKRSLKYMVLVIFALATGMTFGPSLGGWLNELIGWRCLYRIIRTLAALLLLIYIWEDRRERYDGVEPFVIKAAGRSPSDWKSRYNYSFVYLTGVFHSGVFVWISHYFTTHYGLDEFQIATDLFIFGLPGFVVTLLMYFYRLDKKVITILYASLGVTIAGLLALMVSLPLWLAECLLGIMSIGFGCSQPLFIGILKLPRVGSSPIEPVAKGSAILFAGYGTGPLIMLALLSVDLAAAMLFLILLVLALAYTSRRVWNAGVSKVIPVIPLSNI
ncbi:MFS transporter [Mucilaginibacter terrae]|uniref:MFS family arabinose efflux permease n=1 Tax=Mucilaginibacter terrae TaxID=1955052 RepID=A0ABU3GR48_9SPHI|nr:MFS transporter [Mucilaginibacter terrae]MDT3402026.1 putative MFS family arabinose efflux permease [Mucilaginibacter terrae]